MTDRAELIDDLRQFFTYTDEEQQDIVDKAIAALEAKEPARCSLTTVIESVIASIQNCAAGKYDIEALEYVLCRVAALEAKPERTVGNIQDFKEMLRNQENDSSSLRITLGDFKQIAKALMAIEPKCKTCKDTHTVLKGIKVIECGCGGSIRACSLCKGYGVYQQDTIADCPDCEEAARQAEPAQEKI